MNTELKYKDVTEKIIGTELTVVYPSLQTPHTLPGSILSPWCSVS
jgi:hypothetical protein